MSSQSNDRRRQRSGRKALSRFRSGRPVVQNRLVRCSLVKREIRIGNGQFREPDPVERCL
jgi:hypothetical protein